MITLKIEGMMCPRCQKHVEDALSAVAGVTPVVDLKAGTAVVEGGNATAQQLSDAVTAAGYTVVCVQE